MSLIQWQDSFSVGVDAIDADHRVLISLLNQLFEAREEGQARDVVGSVVNVLVEYTISHFGREERLMEAGGYPDIAAHKEIHRVLAIQVQGYQRQYHEGRHAAVDELFDFLKNWLIGHILKADVAYKPWVENVPMNPKELLGTFGRTATEGGDDGDFPGGLA